MCERVDAWSFGCMVVWMHGFVDAWLCGCLVVCPLLCLLLRLLLCLLLYCCICCLLNILHSAYTPALNCPLFLSLLSLLSTSLPSPPLSLLNTLTSLVRKSAPIVALYWEEKRFDTYWFIRDVLPTLVWGGREGEGLEWGYL